MSDKKNQPEIHHPQAPPFDPRTMVAVRSEEHELFVHLSQEDALVSGQEAARKRQQAAQMRKDLADHSKVVKDEIKSLETQAAHLESACDLEARKEPVLCDVVFDYSSNQALTVRKDTGQVQTKLTRTLQKHEIEAFQTSIDTDSHLRSAPTSNSAPSRPQGGGGETSIWAREIRSALDMYGAPMSTDDLMEAVGAETDAKRRMAEIVLMNGIQDDQWHCVNGLWSLPEWDDEPDTFPEADEEADDETDIDHTILAICGREARGATIKAIVKECLQRGEFGDDADDIAALVGERLAALKDAGRVDGRFGRGKRWTAVPQ